MAGSGSHTFSIDQRLLEAAQQAEDACKADFERIEKNAAYNSAKVLAAFQKSRVSEPCFYGTTGYGYGDQGRGSAGSGIRRGVRRRGCAGAP